MFDIKKITMIYDMEKAEKVYALGGFDLTLPDKGLIGIIGPSGSGKSTLMYCLSTLKKPTDGSILYNGKELTKLKNSERENIRRNEFGFVFQRHFLVPYMSAIDNVTVAARAMINNPKVLFADEPTAALDHENAFAVMKILKEYSKENLVLVITHDRSILSDADSVIEMWDGNVSAIKGGEEI